MDYRICVIGVGFVGEHLLSNFSRNYDVVGVDLSVSRTRLLSVKYQGNHFQSHFEDLDDRNVFLISVPTLVKDNDIDISSIYSVKKSLEKVVKPGSLVMIESSVYVGATEKYFLIS